MPKISYQGDLKKMQPECQTQKINSVFTKTDEYVYFSYTHISPALSFPKKKEENIVDLTTPSLSSLSIDSPLYPLTFNKHPTPTIPVNYFMKGQRSPFTNIQNLWKQKIQPEVELEISILILKYLYFVLIFNQKEQIEIFMPTQPLLYKPKPIKKISQKVTFEKSLEKSLEKQRYDEIIEIVSKGEQVPYYTKLPKMVVEIQVLPLPSIRWNLRKRKSLVKQILYLI